MIPTVLFLAGLGLTTAHMIMNTPTPYNHHTAPLIQVDPLGAAHPFPCQGLSTIESTTSITAGTTQLVNFTGGAQHGGGSCQFSLTYEYPPSADKSKWRTIYTLIGGCPVSSAGNLPAASPDQDGRADSPHCGNDSGVECIRQFNVPIPKGIPNGNATFAWTWFNKIGNREVYMNCAPVAITGGSDDGAFFEALPEMFVANVAGECTTGNGVLNIPNPGKFGRVLEQPTEGSEGSCEKAAGLPVFDGQEEIPGEPGEPTETETETVPSATSTDTPSAFPTTFLTRTTSFVVAEPTAPTVPVGPGQDQSCSPDGAIICIGNSQFGLCDHGRAVPQPLAPGTSCVDGVIGRR
ncbi:hypothetical protein OQA88_2676 [Cercophora sp. LCS_1]